MTAGSERGLPEAAPSPARHDPGLLSRLPRRRVCGYALSLALAGPLPALFGVRASSADAGRGGKLLEALSARARRSFQDLAKRGLPGALIGLRQGAGEAQALALGVADIETGAPMTTEMTMRLGSLAKLFVGTVALQLVDERRIGLDDAVSAYRPDVPGGAWMTLRMLGNHTSGLFNPLRDPAFRERVNRAPARHIPREEILQVAFRNTRARPPDEGFNYSNANTILLAEIIEKVTAKPLMGLLRARVLEPFGARGIAMPWTHELAAPAPRGYRFGARRGAIEYGEVFFDATGFSASWAGAAGNMNGTLDDLLSVARGLASGETLSAESRHEQRRFLGLGASFDYGFGLARYGRALGHAGDVPGFSSFLAWHPEHDAVVVVLANLSNLADKSAPATLLGRALLSAMEES